MLSRIGLVLTPCDNPPRLVCLALDSSDAEHEGAVAVEIAELDVVIVTLPAATRTDSGNSPGVLKSALAECRRLSGGHQAWKGECVAVAVKAGRESRQLKLGVGQALSGLDRVA